MLSPNDRVPYPQPSFIFGANRYIGDAHELVKHLKSISLQELRPEDIEQIRLLARGAIDCSQLLLAETLSRDTTEDTVSFT